VKSYSWSISFYFTRNEINNARIRKDTYYLYLVNRDEIETLEYQPIIIQNPYEHILQENTDRAKEVDTYYITKISQEKPLSNYRHE
jgi:hypothetical protein